MTRGLYAGCWLRAAGGDGGQAGERMTGGGCGAGDFPGSSADGGLRAGVRAGGGG